jgi:hypothetical protein
MGSVVLWGAQRSSPGHDRAGPEGSRAMLLRHNERWIASRRIGLSPVPVMVGEFTPVALCQLAQRGLVGPPMHSQTGREPSRSRASAPSAAHLHV